MATGNMTTISRVYYLWETCLKTGHFHWRQWKKVNPIELSLGMILVSFCSCHCKWHYLLNVGLVLSEALPGHVGETTTHVSFWIEWNVWKKYIESSLESRTLWVMRVIIIWWETRRNQSTCSENAVMGISSLAVIALSLQERFTTRFW